MQRTFLQAIYEIVASLIKKIQYVNTSRRNQDFFIYLYYWLSRLSFDASALLVGNTALVMSNKILKYVHRRLIQKRINS